MNEPDPVEQGYRALRAIRRIIRRVSSHSRRVASDTGLTVPQILCMRAVEESDADEVTVAAVADAVSLSRSTVSVVVERLVKRGMMTRVRSERDRRRVHLALTDEGALKLNSVAHPLQDRFLDRLIKLAPDERERLLATLEQVVNMMDAEDLDAAPMLVPGLDLPGATD